MGYGIEIAIAAIIGAAIGSGSAAARGAEGKEIALSGLAGAAIGAATSGVGTAFQAGGQGAQAGAQAGAQGAASGAAGGAASGAGSAAISSTASEASKGLVLPLLEEAAEANVETTVATVGTQAAETVPSAALSAPNTAGMEVWPSIPQYMRYGGEHGGLLNQAQYLAEGAYNYPGVQQGMDAGRYGSALGGMFTPPPTTPNYAGAMAGRMPVSRQGMEQFKNLQPQQQQTSSVGSALGQGWNPEEPDYWTSQANQSNIWR